MKGVSFCIDGAFYAADAACVQKFVRKLAVSHVPASPDEVVGIAGVNGKAVTILDADALVRDHKDPAGRRSYGVRRINAIIFKPFSGDDDRMGLAIDKPGDLIELDDGKISQPGRHITGVAESGGTLYRIIDINSIIRRYKDGDRDV